MAAALRHYDGLDVKISASSVRNAIQDNRIYRDVRWAYLDADLPDDTVQELEPSRPAKKYHTGLVAEMGGDGAVRRVFKNRSDAAKALGYSSSAGFNRRMQDGDEIGEQQLRYRDWDILPEEVKSAYRQELPERPENRANTVQRLDEDGTVIRSYPSQESVCHELRVSLRTLQRAAAGNCILRGSRWLIGVTTARARRVEGT